MGLGEFGKGGQVFELAEGFLVAPCGVGTDSGFEVGGKLSKGGGGLCGLWVLVSEELGPKYVDDEAASDSC